MYTLYFSKRAEKDMKYLKASKLDKKVRELLNTISESPFRVPPPYEMLLGSLKGYCSRRISYQHRLVYYVIEDQKAVMVERMWSHY